MSFINLNWHNLLYNIIVYSSNVLKLEGGESFDNTNMTVQCCVEDVESLSSNDNCTIIIKEGEINEMHQSDHQKCLPITIPEKLHQHENLSIEAHIDGDPDICYRIIIYGGN